MTEDNSEKATNGGQQKKQQRKRRGGKKQSLFYVGAFQSSYILLFTVYSSVFTILFLYT